MRRAPLLAVTLLLAACGATPGVEEGEPLPPADAVYEVEGVVYDLPSGEGAARELVVHHQAVPGFLSREGERVGMDSMTMGFAVTPGLDLAGIAKGDPVRMTFEVRWDADPTLRVAALEELPAGHEIDWQNAGEPVAGEAAVDVDEGTGEGEGSAP